MHSRPFQLELPISVICAGVDGAPLAGKTRNISSTGVLFDAAGQPDLEGLIEYVITLSNDSRQSVKLRCLGRVLRSEPAGGENQGERGGFQISATLERYKFVRDVRKKERRPATPGALLSRGELSRRIAQDIDVPLEKAEEVLETILNAMVHALQTEGRIEIRGFGVFWLHLRSARTGRNPQTGASVEVPAKKVVHFKPSREIARRLLGGELPLTQGAG